jgi:hypothetical protein
MIEFLQLVVLVAILVVLLGGWKVATPKKISASMIRRRYD